MIKRVMTNAGFREPARFAWRDAGAATIATKGDRREGDVRVHPWIEDQAAPTLRANDAVRTNHRGKPTRLDSRLSAAAAAVIFPGNLSPAFEVH
jgi:hypothetical protein